MKGIIGAILILAIAYHVIILIMLACGMDKKKKDRKLPPKSDDRPPYEGEG